MELPINQIICGNCIDVLKTFPANSINCAITSPPYWSLRSYGTPPQIWGGDKDCEHNWQEHKTPPKGGHTKPDNMPNVGSNKSEQNGEMSIRFGHTTAFCSKCNAWRGELGLEPTYQAYIEHLLSVFDEVKRVLRDDGTCWVNIGDTYNSHTVSKEWAVDAPNKKFADSAIRNGGRYSQYIAVSGREKNIGLLDKCLIGIPERFMLGMIDRGWILRSKIIWHKPSCMPSSVKDRFTVDFEMVYFFVKNPKYFFETQYEPLADITIKRLEQGKWEAQEDSKINAGVLPMSADSFNKAILKMAETGKRIKRCVWSINTQPSQFEHYAAFPEKLVEPMIMAGCPIDGVVLDIFAGTGTTCRVATKLQRNYIGIELHKQNAGEFAVQNLVEAETGISISEQKNGQLSLFLK
jgi:site-specific DNA-methyltransferase (adenine-specific)